MNIDEMRAKLEESKAVMDMLVSSKFLSPTDYEHFYEITSRVERKFSREENRMLLEQKKVTRRKWERRNKE